uniref:G_PROTEIN_RECEP_F1_2 domain-containing protein n=1 Tax=Trichobilharzia regenti TaxID=157069 RepID=A0AA85KFU5_TRIRE|nr:unnamed protein product [Trichobilharzia regenti]CAH8851524.1 unnamed protein product [Trichobilharzia regenti]
MVPCILLVFINSIILIKLISIKTRRRILCKREDTHAHLINWTSNGKSSITPQNDPTSPTKALASALATMLLKRRRHTILEDRKELGRVVALLLLSCFYLCFTFPVSISLTIRASLNDQHDKCVHTLYAHLSRLLTSIKDINYALNGYTYALFFQFYRHKLLQIFTCKFTTSANNNTHYTRRDGNTATCSRNNRRQSSSTT